MSKYELNQIKFDEKEVGAHFNYLDLCSRLLTAKD